MSIAWQLSPVDIHENLWTKHQLVMDYLPIITRQISKFNLVTKDDNLKESYETSRKIKEIMLEEAENLKREYLHGNPDSIVDAQKLRDIFVILARLEITKMRVIATIKDKDWNESVKQDFIANSPLRWIKEENSNEEYFNKNGTYSWICLDFEEWLPCEMANQDRRLKETQNPSPKEIKTVEAPPKVGRDFDFFRSSQPPSDALHKSYSLQGRGYTNSKEPRYGGSREPRYGGSRESQYGGSRESQYGGSRESQYGGSRESQYIPGRSSGGRHSGWYPQRSGDGSYNSRPSDSTKYQRGRGYRPSQNDTPPPPPLTDAEGWSITGQKKPSQQKSCDSQGRGYNSGRGFSGHGRGMGRRDSGYGKSW